MINIIDEVGELLNEYNLNLNDVIFVFNGNVVENEDFLEKYDVFYDNGWGLCNFTNIQINQSLSYFCRKFLYLKFRRSVKFRLFVRINHYTIVITSVFVL